MALATTHNILISPRDNEGDPRRASFETRCDCGWQGLAHTREIAVNFANSHAYAQSVRGNHVIIGIDPALAKATEEHQPKRAADAEASAS